MLADDPVGKALVDEIDRHAEDCKRLLVVGFARFVIDRGEGALAPAAAPGKNQETWQAVGRRLYGVALFKETLRRELEARKEQARATEERISNVRGSEGEISQAGQAASSGKDQRGKDHKQPRRKGPAAPSAST